MKNEDHYCEDQSKQEDYDIAHERTHYLLFKEMDAPLLNPTKDSIEGKVKDWTDAIASGYIDPFEAHIRVKALAKVCETVLKNIDESAVTTARKHGKSGSFLGVDFSISEGRANYKFDNSPAIITMENKLKAMKELAKTLAKTNASAVADTETGEVIEKARTEYGKETISITFK